MTNERGWTQNLSMERVKSGVRRKKLWTISVSEIKVEEDLWKFWPTDTKPRLS